MAIRFVINLGSDVKPMMDWLIGFVDRMAKYKMTTGERK